MGKWQASLETFLVEWKHVSERSNDPERFFLETFLVEWKPYGCREVDRGLHALETFLVEWKLAALAGQMRTGGALKPS